MLGALALAGCVPPTIEDTGDEGTAHVTATLTSVPTGVLCIQIKVAVGGATTTKNFDVAAGGATTSLSLGKLAAGAATFTGAAYTVACASVTTTSTPDWIADSAMATLQPGVSSSVEMTFRRNNSVSVSANFLDNVAEVIVGGFQTYARMADGSVKQWGLFGGTVSELSPTPVPVPSLTDAVQVAAGSSFACARRKTGAVVCWGFNAKGVLGQSPTTLQSSKTPIQIIASGAVDVAAGDAYACAIVANKSMVCWGANNFGQLGNNTMTDSLTPVMVQNINFVKAAAGRETTCAIKDLGDVMCWGRNDSGQVGDGTNVTRPKPVNVPLTGTVDLTVGGDHTCAMRADGTVRCWGGGATLGDGTEMGSFTPKQAVGLTDATQIEAGYFHTCARRQNGQVSCWGAGDHGQLGDGSSELKLVPTVVPNLSGVTAVHAHVNRHTCAELTNRTVKCWGMNQEGEVGDGTLSTKFVPTLVKLQ